MLERNQREKLEKFLGNLFAECKTESEVICLAGEISSCIKKAAEKRINETKE